MTFRYMDRFVIALIFVFALAAAPQFAVADEDLSAANMARAKAATVFVDLGAYGSGSAFLVDASGLFATNRHVADAVPPGSPIKLGLNSGEDNQKVVSARVVYLSEDADLALLKTDEPVKAEPLKLSDDVQLVELTKTIVFGYPYGKMLAEGSGSYPAISINVGRISSLRRENGQLERIQMDASTNPGNSGGPVLDKDGRVIGVVVSGIRGALVNFAIPSAKLLAMVKQPTLSLQAPEIVYSHRSEPREFNVEIFPTAPIPADGEIALKLGEPGPGQRVFPVQRTNGKLSVTAPPCDPATTAGPLRLRFEADFGAFVVTANTDDCRVRAGNKKPWLSEVRSVDWVQGKLVATLAHFDKDSHEYQTSPGWVFDMPKLYGEHNDVYLDPYFARHIRIGAYDPGLVEMPWELVMTSKGQVAASAHGMLHFLDTPRGLEPDDEANRSGGESESQRAGSYFRSLQEQPFRADGLMDPSKDARAGTWTRNSERQLETGAEKAAWCDVPVLPTTDYRVQVVFTPAQKARGELDLQFPVGKGRALLHVNGEKGAMTLDLAGGAIGDENKVTIPAFEIDKAIWTTVSVGVHGKHARIVAERGSATLTWTGDMNRLAAPKDAPAGLAPLALGAHDLEMTVNFLNISTEDGGLRILREIAPSVHRRADLQLGRYPLDFAPKEKKIPTASEHGIPAIQIGSPEIGMQPAALGVGAMRLKGDGSGLQLEENQYSNKGASPPGRAVSFWFRADAPAAPNQRQYLFSEGGAVRGYAVYLENGTLFAGGWDLPENWKGNWLSAPGITANEWYQVTLIVNGKASDKDKDKAFFFALNGKDMGHCFGKTFGSHEPIYFGTPGKTIRFAEDPAPNPQTTNHSFSGMMDEVEIFSQTLNKEEQRIVAGGRFEAKHLPKSE